jgi:rfaE bifunctional protein nucleotidyltransferase chain/domain
MKRLIPRKHIGQFAKRLRAEKLRIVFTNGVFDLLHRGHVEYLARSRSYGDVLIIGINSDASVRRLKGKGRPLQSARDRAAVLLALEVVDAVVIFGEDTPERLIRQVRPDVLVKGADYKLSEIVGADFVRSCGGVVRRAPIRKGQSTSRLIKAVSKPSRGKKHR